MKKLLTIIFLLFFSISFSQSTVELNMSTKEYKKIAKKLDLKITNRGYDGTGKIWVKVADYSSDRKNAYTKFWNEALFEMDMPTGQVTDSDDDTIYINADWIFQLDGSIGKNTGGYTITSGGGLSGKILDFNDNSKVIATFSTREGMAFLETLNDGVKRGEKFKQMVKVVVNEILLTIK